MQRIQVSRSLQQESSGQQHLIKQHGSKESLSPEPTRRVDDRQRSGRWELNFDSWRRLGKQHHNRGSPKVTFYVTRPERGFSLWGGQKLPGKAEKKEKENTRPSSKTITGTQRSCLMQHGVASWQFLKDNWRHISSVCTLTHSVRRRWSPCQDWRHQHTQAFSSTLPSHGWKKSQRSWRSPGQVLHQDPTESCTRCIKPAIKCDNFSGSSYDGMEAWGNSSRMVDSRRDLHTQGVRIQALRSIPSHIPAKCRGEGLFRRASQENGWFPDSEWAGGHLSAEGRSPRISGMCRTLQHDLEHHTSGQGEEAWLVSHVAWFGECLWLGSSQAHQVLHGFLPYPHQDSENANELLWQLQYEIQDKRLHHWLG